MTAWEEKISAQLEALKILGESGDDYLLLWDLKNEKMFFAGDIKKRYDLQLDADGSCKVEDWMSIVYKTDRPAIQQYLKEIKQGNLSRYILEYRLVNRVGDRVWVNSRGQCQMDAAGKPQVVISRISDTALEPKVDQLTGVFNASRLSEDMGRIQKAHISAVLMMFGIDNLKYINLRHGREYGDKILKQIADTLEELLGPGLRVYRVGGDCFAINLPEERQNDAEKIYYQLSSRMEGLCNIFAGAVSYQEHPTAGIDMIYQYAEEALDKAKQTGKDEITFFSQNDYEKQLSALELIEELQQSIKNHFSGFSLWYQPQIQSENYELFGVEALLRYHSPSKGDISPCELIPILEQTGMICPVGMWTLRTALEQCRRWRKIFPKMHVSVNLSYVQFRQNDISRQVLNLLEIIGLPGDALTFEVTESIQLQNYNHLNQIFYQWNQAGIEISVDDFGTGYSSLGYLKNLKIDEIKIDRSFVRGIQNSAYNYRLLKNMIELAHSSQIRVCCEGMETLEELMTLQELHPDLLQGFLFSRPLPVPLLEKTYLQQDTIEYQSWTTRKIQLQQLKWVKSNSVCKKSNSLVTLESIVNALDEIVYVSDPKTYDLYYLNATGQRLTGFYDYKGQKCYKVLQGRESPCEFCTNSCLRKDRFYVWELDNKKFHRHFILKDKLIIWAGKAAKLELATDISNQETVSGLVQEKLDFAHSIPVCVRALAKEDDFEKAVEQLISTVAHFYQSDSVYLFELVSDQWHNTRTWYQNRIRTEPVDPPKISSAVMEYWLSLFYQDKSVVISDLDKIRDSRPEEWEVLHTQKIHRLMAVPIFQGDKLIAFLRVDNPRRHVLNDSMARTLSLFIACKFGKNRVGALPAQPSCPNHRDILNDMAMGFWVIRVNRDGSKKEMFTDDIMRRQVLGLDQQISPEECYNYWYQRIEDGYRLYVQLTLESMIRSGQVVQLEYLWQHPLRGKVMVSCTGIRTEYADGKISLEGYHRIVQRTDQMQFLPTTPGGEVFEFHENQHEILFHTKRRLFAGDSLQEENFPDCWIEQKIVHPHFAKYFSALFNHAMSSKDIDEQEIPLRSKQGNYEWFRIRIRHLRADEKKQNTILVFLDAADREKVLWLENMRIRDFYHASLSEAIAYAEVDLESGQLSCAGGLWSGYEEEYNREQGSLLQFMRRKAQSIVQVNANLDNLKYPDSWKELFSNGTPIQRFLYQRKIGSDWRWVELVAHSFREKFTDNMYALLYLKDIDAQVRKEKAQQEAASRDPLTGVYNRNAFESSLQEYLSNPDESGRGTLILFDIDDFKQVNDHFGHLEGDRALRYFTKLLRSCFRQHDIVGRMGGDEFLVFLKGMTNRQILDQRIQKLKNDLSHYSKVPLSCSAGILFVQKENFSYWESIQCVDTALYRSKQRGKGCHTYAED